MCSEKGVMSSVSSFPVEHSVPLLCYVFVVIVLVLSSAWEKHLLVLYWQAGLFTLLTVDFYLCIYHASLIFLFHCYKPVFFFPLQRVKSGRESSARGRREGSASSGKWTVLFHPHQSIYSAVCNVQHFTLSLPFF